MPRLPIGLTQSTYLRPIPTSVAGFASCPGCAALKLTYVGLSCPYLKPAGMADEAANTLNWELDPEYYLFQGCACDLVRRGCLTTCAQGS